MGEAKQQKNIKKRETLGLGAGVGMGHEHIHIILHINHKGAYNM